MTKKEAMMDWFAWGSVFALITIIVFKIGDLRSEVDELKLQVDALEKRDQ